MCNEEEDVVIDMTDEEVDKQYNKEVVYSDFVSCGDAFSLYIKDVMMYKVMSVEDERKYTKLYYETKDKAIKELLINCNLRLVINMSKTYRNMYVDMMDLVQEGNMGLIRGIEKYNPEMGYRLTTYCVWWIRQAMQRYIHNNHSVIRCPVHIGEQAYRYRKFVATYKVSHMGEEPSEKEILNALNIDSKTLQTLVKVSQLPVSLDTPVGEESDSTLGDFIEAPDTTSDEGEYSSLQSDLAEALSVLDDRERAIINYRFGLIDGRERTLEEIGHMFNVTRERIRQIEGKAMRKLRHPNRKSKLQDYIK